MSDLESVIETGSFDPDAGFSNERYTNLQEPLLVSQHYRDIKRQGAKDTFKTIAALTCFYAPFFAAWEHHMGREWSEIVKSRSTSACFYPIIAAGMGLAKAPLYKLFRVPEEVITKGDKIRKYFANTLSIIPVQPPTYGAILLASGDTVPELFSAHGAAKIMGGLGIVTMTAPFFTGFKMGFDKLWNRVFLDKN